MVASLIPTPTYTPPTLAAGQSCFICIEPFQVGDEIKLDIYVSYLDPTFTQQTVELELQPQGLWNGLAPLIFFLQSGVLPGYQINGQGPQPKFDLSRVLGGVLPQKGFAMAPPPTVDWPFSRRTEVQQDVDAGELDAAGNPVTNPIPVRPPSYSGPYATTQTQTENDINSAALAAYVPPPSPPAVTSLSPNTAAATTSPVVTINGSGFLTGAVVKVGGTTITPTTVTATAITVTIPSADITPAGTHSVSVENTNGQASNSMNFVST